MRLHIPHQVGSGDGLCGSHYRAKELITVTPAEIIYQRRVAVLAHTAKSGNVAETCRVFGISRTRYYEWKKVAESYGLDALMPKGRRRPQMPEATPTHVVERLLTLAVVEPTIGCRQYADRLGDQGFAHRQVDGAEASWSTHGLGKQGGAPVQGRSHHGGHHRPGDRGSPRRRALRVLPGHGGPGELVCLDSFYIGKLKGVGKVYQLTAVDVFTRWAVVA